MEIAKIGEQLVITLKGSSSSLSRVYDVLVPNFEDDVVNFLEFSKSIGFEIDSAVTGSVTFIDVDVNFEFRVSNPSCENNPTYNRIFRSLISKDGSLLNTKLRQEYGFELS